MDSGQRAKVELAGNSEADWSWGSRSSTGLPGFVKDEFEHMIELGEEVEAAEQDSAADETSPGEEPIDYGIAENPLDAAFEYPEDSSLTEYERAILLDEQMDKLLEAAGQDRDDTAGRRSRILSRLPTVAPIRGVGR